MITIQIPAPLAFAFGLILLVHTATMITSMYLQHRIAKLQAEIDKEQTK